MPVPQVRATPAAPDPSSTELGARLPRVMSRLGRQLRQAYGPLGVNPGQYPVLAWLVEHPGSTVSALAAREGVQPPSMTALLNQMASQGLVEKRADPDDRRWVRLTLTPQGAALAEAAQSARRAWFEARLAHLGRGEVAAIGRALVALEHLVGMDA